MTVTITITDPTATEATALRAYLTALHGGPAAARSDTTQFRIKADQFVIHNPTDRPFMVEEGMVTIQNTAEQTRNAMSELSESQAVTAEDAGAPDFDSAGMPWDERIHASSRATVADGTWRKKRGVSDELVADVEAELKQDPAVQMEVAEAEVKTILGAPEVPEAPVGESLTPAPIAEPNSTTATAGASSAEQQVADTGSATDAPPPPPAPTANPFLAVMSRIGKSKLDKAKKDELLTAAGALDEKGAPSILVLNKRPELIDGFIALLDSEGV